MTTYFDTKADQPLGAAIDGGPESAELRRIAEAREALAGAGFFAAAARLPEPGQGLPGHWAVAEILVVVAQRVSADIFIEPAERRALDAVAQLWLEMGDEDESPRAFEVERVRRNGPGLLAARPIMGRLCAMAVGDAVLVNGRAVRRESMERWVTEFAEVPCRSGAYMTAAILAMPMQKRRSRIMAEQKRVDLGAARAAAATARALDAKRAAPDPCSACNGEGQVTVIENGEERYPGCDHCNGSRYEPTDEPDVRRLAGLVEALADEVMWLRTEVAVERERTDALGEQAVEIAHLREDTKGEGP